jgi:glucose/arabinose dehydrogenase
MPPMRKLAIVLLFAASCGNKSPGRDDAAPGHDDAPGDSGPACAIKPALPACTAPALGTAVKARQIGRVAGGAMLATSPPNDPRLFVIEQRGAIRIFDNQDPLTGMPALLPDPFLDISGGDIVAGGEQGLLGLAFHPCYDSNGEFFIYYTTSNRNTVARCTVSSDPNKANPTCTPILEIPDFASNHNGGMIEFGKDGYLYIGTGDGGGANDPALNGQALVDGSPCPGAPNCQAGRTSVALLGKILRIDVDNKLPGKEYGIPSSNPFANGGGAPEIFVIGVRNPWRWSFDTENGDLWIGDVGQDVLEEVDVLKAGQQAGVNLGWSMYEGTNCFHAPCNPAGKTMPQDTRTHSSGWNAIIGGQVYRGTCYPDLAGWYFYTDNVHHVLVKARLKTDNTLEIVDLTGTFPTSPASIHADARGELYMTNTDGFVYHIEAGP